MKNSTKVVAAALIGMAVGAGLALLLAPESGEETREKIKNKFKDLEDKIKNKKSKGNEPTSESVE